MFAPSENEIGKPAGASSVRGKQKHTSSDEPRSSVPEPAAHMLTRRRAGSEVSLLSHFFRLPIDGPVEQESGNESEGRPE